MQNKKSVMIGVVVTLVLIAGGTAYWSFNFQKKKAESFTQISSLSVKMSQSKKELLELYEQRFTLLKEWSKLAGVKLPAHLLTPYTGDLKSEEDFKSFDFYQMGITNELSTLITNPVLKKRIRELEIIENQINRKRASYHEDAFEADSLIKKYKTGQPTAPVFPAEKLLQDQKR